MTQLMRKLAKPIGSLTVAALFSQFLLLCCISVASATASLSNSTDTPSCHQAAPAAENDTNTSAAQIPPCNDLSCFDQSIGIITHNAVATCAETGKTELVKALQNHQPDSLLSTGKSSLIRYADSTDSNSKTALYLTHCAFLE